MSLVGSWNNNDVQFPRLLAEVYAVGLTDVQYRELGESTGLERAQIDELFKRADTVFEKLKPQVAREMLDLLEKEHVTETIDMKELAKRLLISIPTARRWVKLGMPHTRAGRAGRGSRHFFDWDEVVEWMRTEGQRKRS